MRDKNNTMIEYTKKDQEDTPFLMIAWYSLKRSSDGLITKKPPLKKKKSQIIRRKIYMLKRFN